MLVLFPRQIGVRSDLLGFTEGVLERFLFLKHATAVPPARQTIPASAKADTTRILKGKDGFPFELPDLNSNVKFWRRGVAAVTLVVATSSSFSPPVWFGVGGVSVCLLPLANAASLALAKIKTIHILGL